MWGYLVTVLFLTNCGEMAKTHPNCPRAHHPLKKREKEKQFFWLQGALCGVGHSFYVKRLHFLPFSRSSQRFWIILAALWNVP